MSASDWIALASLLTIVAGGFFAWFQWKKSNSLRRAEFLDEIIQKLRFDEEFTDIIYRIDYSEFEYNELFHTVDNEDQIKLDKLLSYLDYICYLKGNKILTDKEFSPCRYVINRVCSDMEVCCYLWNIYHFAHQFQKDCSFECLIKYCLSNKIFIVDDFESVKCPYFTSRKYLNF